MKIKISYYYIKSDHILATPEFDHSEIVEVKDTKALENYLSKQKDQYGHPFKREKAFGFDYISRAGAIKISQYKEPRIKKIK